MAIGTTENLSPGSNKRAIGLGFTSGEKLILNEAQNSIDEKSEYREQSGPTMPDG